MRQGYLLTVPRGASGFLGVSQAPTIILKPERKTGRRRRRKLQPQLNISDSWVRVLGSRASGCQDFRDRVLEFKGIGGQGR